LGFASSFAVRFGPQKADKDHEDKKAKEEVPNAPDAEQEEEKEQLSSEEILLILRVQVDSSPVDLLALTTILLGGTPALGVQVERGGIPAICGNCYVIVKKY